MVEFRDDRKKGKLFCFFVSSLKRKFVHADDARTPDHRPVHHRQGTYRECDNKEWTEEEKKNLINEMKWNVLHENDEWHSLPKSRSDHFYRYILVSNVMNSTRKHLENSFGTTTTMTPAIWSLRLSNRMFKLNGSCRAFFIEFVSLEIKFWIYSGEGKRKT